MGNEAKLNADKKFEEFKKDPNAFIKISELVIAVKKTDEGSGLMLLISSKASGDQLLLARAKLHRHVDNILNMMEVQRLKKQHEEQLIKVPGRPGAFSGVKH